jgi:P-type Cu2+ transporter
MGRSTTDAGKNDGERGAKVASHEGHGGGMAYGGNDHNGGHGDHATLFRSRFWVSLVSSVPVVYAAR